MIRHFAAPLILALTMLQLPSASASPDESRPETAAEPVDMAEMMARARELTQPGEHHAFLKRFVGTWDTEFRLTMGGVAGEPEKGSVTFSWLMADRWLRGEMRGTTMGMPNDSFMILGYDNFKKSYVTVTVSTLDTAMLTSEGDLDPGGKALITYGTLDEYLTGEHDKMVRYIWRFPSDDRMVLEVHDLPIGEHGTQVIEVTYKRRKSA